MNNPIHKFLYVPLWLFLLARLFPQQANVVDIGLTIVMYKQLSGSITPGYSRLQRWLVKKAREYIDREIKALETLQGFGVVIVCGGVKHE